MFLAAAALTLTSLVSGCKKKVVQTSAAHAEPTPAATSVISPTPTSQVTTAEATPNTAPKAMPTTHGPKLRHPERGIVGQPEPPSPLRDRIRREFDGIAANDPRFFETLRRLWTEFNLPAFDRSLSSASNPQIGSGKLLPSELIAMMEQGQAPDASLSFAKQPNEKDAVEMLQMLASMSGAVGGNHLPGLLEERANQLPPTNGDVALYAAVTRGIQEMNPSTNRPYLELWQPLADAKNPVYRLLAVQAVNRSISSNARGISTEDRRFSVADAPAKVAFLRPFLAEQDPLILTEAVRAMGSLPSPEAKAELETFRDVQRKAGNESLAVTAEEALRTCDSLLAATARIR